MFLVLMIIVAFVDNKVENCFFVDSQEDTPPLVLWALITENLKLEKEWTLQKLKWKCKRNNCKSAENKAEENMLFRKLLSVIKNRKNKAWKSRWWGCKLCGLFNPRFTTHRSENYILPDRSFHSSTKWRSKLLVTLAQASESLWKGSLYKIY